MSNSVLRAWLVILQLISMVFAKSSIKELFLVWSKIRISKRITKQCDRDCLLWTDQLLNQALFLLAVPQHTQISQNVTINGGPV